MTSSCIKVHLVKAHPLPTERVKECLSSEDHQRASQFKNPSHGALWSGYRAALRLILGNHLGLEPKLVPLTTNETGKPVLAAPFESLHFNLSHCDDLALIAISTLAPVGIDLESRTRAPDLLECESTFCHPTEIASLPPESDSRSRRLLEIWTAKEAYLKAIGTGLLTPPEQVVIEWHGSDAVASASGVPSCTLRRLDHPGLMGHIAHLCALQPIARVEMLETLPMVDHRNPSVRGNPWPT